MEIKPLSLLTNKENEIRQLLAKGMMYKKIAAQQGTGVDTVKKHTKNIYRKPDVRNRTEAIMAIEGIHVSQNI